MSVARQAVSQSHASAAASTNQASFSWTHTTAGSPKGVLVFVFSIAATGSDTGVTYGGTALNLVSGGEANDTATEPGTVRTYFLGSGIPAGANPTVQVDRTNNAIQMWAVCYTVTAAIDTEIVGTTIQEENGTFAALSINDGSTGVNSLRFAAGYSGGSNILAAATGSTVDASNDLGLYTCTTAYETTPGQGARNVGFTYATSDDRAYVGLAVREYHQETAVIHDSSVGSSTATWAHVNSDAGNAIIVACRDSNNGNAVTAVSYGAVSLSKLGFRASGSGSDGVVFWGKIGGLPTGSNTVTVTGFSVWAGSATYLRADSFGSIFTSFSSSLVNTGSVTITGTTTDGMCVAATSFGSSGAPTATSPSTLRWSELLDSGSGSGNGWLEDRPSVGGGSSTAIAWTNANTDIYGMVGIEILPAATISSATGAVSMKKMTVSGTGAGISVAAGAPVLKKLTIYGYGGPEIGDITGAISLKKMTVSGTGAGFADFSGGPRLKKMKIAGSGEPPVPYITGLSGGATGYFVDQFDQPILVWGDETWGLPSNAGRWNGGDWAKDYDDFLTARQAQGINVLYTHPYGHTITGGINNDGRTYDGVLPFVGGNPGSLNDTFWQRIDYLLTKARSLGITVFMNIGYRYDVDNGCLSGKNTTQWQNYGAALAARYASVPNIVWLFADDYDGTAGNNTYDSFYTSCRTGLRGGGDTHVMSIQNYSETTSRKTLDGLSTEVWGTSYAEFQFIYAYEVGYFGVEFAYGEASPIPVLQGDGYFFAGGTSTYDSYNDRPARQECWWVLSSGSRGKISADEAVWDWQSGALSSMTSHWWWVNNCKNIRTAYEALTGWQDLIPDRSNQLITAGRGTRATYTAVQYEPATSDAYVTGSITADGKLAVIYLSHATTITIDQTKVGGAGNYTAKRMDPVTGVLTSVTAGSTYNSGSWGNNSQGEADWVLVLQGPGTGPEVADATGAVSLKKMTVSGAGSGFSDASGGPRLKKMTVSGSGAGISVITGAPRLKKMMVSGTGTKVSTAAGAISLKKMTLAGAGAGISVMTGGPRLKKMTVSGTGTTISVVTGAVRLKKMTVSGTGTAISDATGAVRLKKMTVSGTGGPPSDIADATGAISLKKMTVSGTGAGISVITGAVRLKKMTLAGTGAGISVATGAPKLKKMTISGSGTKVSTGTGAVSLKKMRVSGAGAGFADFSGGPRLKKMTVSGSGTAISVATGAIRMKKMSIFGYEGEISIATADIRMKHMTVSGTGAGFSDVSGGPRLKKMSVSGTGVGIAVISGGPVLKKMKVAASGTTITAVSAVITLKKFTVHGQGTGFSDITGAVTLKKMTIFGSTVKIVESSDMFIFSLL